MRQRVCFSSALTFSVFIIAHVVQLREYRMLLKTSFWNWNQEYRVVFWNNIVHGDYRIKFIVKLFNIDWMLSAKQLFSLLQIQINARIAFSLEHFELDSTTFDQYLLVFLYAYYVVATFSFVLPAFIFNKQFHLSMYFKFIGTHEFFFAFWNFHLMFFFWIFFL